MHLKHTDGRDEVVGSLGSSELAVSPDGARILFTKPLPQGADLMLIENFK